MIVRSSSVTRARSARLLQDLGDGLEGLALRRAPSRARGRRARPAPDAGWSSAARARSRHGRFRPAPADTRQPFERVRGIHDDDGVIAVRGEFRHADAADAPHGAALGEPDDRAAQSRSTSLRTLSTSSGSVTVTAREGRPYSSVDRGRVSCLIVVRHCSAAPPQAGEYLQINAIRIFPVKI